MNKETQNKIKEKLKQVPLLPGSYQMRNKDGIIIYVGKAKNLKNRLTSYFTGTHTGKTLLLVNEIDDFTYIVTNSELESFILEITLIKKYNPYYNILLKDDKSYPYIEVSDKDIFQVKVVRNINRKKNKNKLFGPYPNVTSARRTVDIINRIYPIRKCDTFKKDVCLFYHINECLGYCKKENVDLVKLEQMKKEIISFLKGDSSIITKKIITDMNKYSESLNFEKAHELKLMLDDINITLKKQEVSLGNRDSFDMFNYYYKDGFLSIHVFFIREGLLFGSRKDIINIVGELSDNLEEYIVKFYEKDNIIPKEIIVPEGLNNNLLQEYLKTNIRTSYRGKVHNLMLMLQNNAKIALEEEEQILKNKESSRLEALSDLKSILKMDNVSKIEAFDNSHLFGTFYVGGMVVFNDFIPQKKEYRKFKINVDVKDDLSAMKEVIYRRYYRLLMEEEIYPNIIVVDGGELQVNVAKEIINDLKLDIRIIGLKKDHKHRTNSLVLDSGEDIPLVNKNNLLLHLTKVQDEVHNYAISYHRQIKSKGMLASLLDVVPGIGDVRKKELLKKFSSFKNMKEANLEELETILNKDVANNLYLYLQSLK